MFLNKTEKPTWQIEAELRLTRLESDTLAIRKKVDAIYEGEVLPLHQRRIDIQHHIQNLTAPDRDKRVDNSGRLANAQKELAAVETAYSEAQQRYTAAQTEASAAIRLLERAKTAWQKTAGGMSLGYDLMSLIKG